MPAPVIVVASGGVPIVNTALGTPMTPATAAIGGLPVTIVDENPPNRGIPVHLVNEDLTDWTP
jgi:hypothetical protein